MSLFSKHSCKAVADGNHSSRHPAGIVFACCPCAHRQSPSMLHRLVLQGACRCDVPLQVVLPIGPMPRDTFDAYMSAFNAHRHVRIAPLVSQPLNTSGSIRTAAAAAAYYVHAMWVAPSESSGRVTSRHTRQQLDAGSILVSPAAAGAD
jgi:hypothetical protein